MKREAWDPGKCYGNGAPKPEQRPPTRHDRLNYLIEMARPLGKVPRQSQACCALVDFMRGPDGDVIVRTLDAAEAVVKAHDRPVAECSAYGKTVDVSDAIERLRAAMNG